MKLGLYLFAEYIAMFISSAVISILFFVAMVGAVMLGKREAGERNF
jgi:NADH-quinone oxidoreductase subunit J